MPALNSIADSTATNRHVVWRHGLLLTLLCGCVYLIGLKTTHLWDDDETYFAQVAREMFERGDWIVPWFNQELFSHKPPVMYWLMMGSFHLFGVNEFAARLPAALFGLANVLLVWRLGRRLYSERAGFWSAVALATSLNFVVIARAAACDAELTFFCTLAVYLFVRGTWPARTDTEATIPTALQPRLSTWIGVYAAMGAAVLTKGPIGVLLPGCVIGLFLLLAKEFPAVSQTTEEPASPLWSRLWSAARRTGSLLSPGRLFGTAWGMRPLLAIAMVLLVAGPWFLAVALRTNGEFLVGFFGTHHFHRFTAKMDNHAGPAWFYLAAICVGFFPWILFLRPGAIEMVRRFRQEPSHRHADLLLLAWVTTWVGFFSMATTKFPHYVVPAYPALALFTGSFLSRWFDRPELCQGGARRLIWGTLLFIGVGIVCVPAFIAMHLRIEARWLWGPGIPVVLGAVFVWRLGSRDRLERAMAVWTTATALFLVLLFTVAAAEIDRGQSTVALARDIHNASQDSDLKIATWRFFRPGLVYYSADQTGVSRIDQFETPEALAQWLEKTPGTRFVVARVSDFEKSRSQLPAGLEIVAREPWFLKPEEELVLLKLSAVETQVARETDVSAGSTRQ